MTRDGLDPRKVIASLVSDNMVAVRSEPVVGKEHDRSAALGEPTRARDVGYFGC